MTTDSEPETVNPLVLAEIPLADFGVVAQEDRQFDLNRIAYDPDRHVFVIFKEDE